MKKREVTPAELKNIIALRQHGSNWTKIEVETNVKRRAAKREYETWERDEQIKSKDAARFRVQAQAWNEHISDLVELACGLVSNLSLSNKLADLEITSAQFFSSLWGHDLLQRYISPETGTMIYLGRLETHSREQELLFESLKVHTKEKVQWNVLDVDWKNARDKCIDIIPRVRKVISEVVSNSILQQKMINSMEEIKKRTVEKEDPQKRIEDGILTQIWKGVYFGDIDSGRPGFKMEVGNEEIRIIRFRDIHSNSQDQAVFTFNNITDKRLAEKVANLCNSAVDVLNKGKEVRALNEEVANIKKAGEELGEMLIPVKLKPIIMHSRCDLCPI